MEELLKLLKSFEERENQSISLLLETNGSGNLCYFSTGESFFEFDDYSELSAYLKYGSIGDFVE